MKIEYLKRPEDVEKRKPKLKNLVVAGLILLTLLIPVSAAGAPPDIINLPPGSFLYTYQPYFELSPDPTITQYSCQISPTPAFILTQETLFQANIGAQPNTIQQYTFVNLTAGDMWHIQCKADDGLGYGAYGPPTSFIIVEGFANKCQPSTEGIYTSAPEAYFEVYAPETPINRTIFQKQTTLTWAYFVPTGSPDIQYEVSYNDTVFTVTDNYTLTGTPSLAILELNNHYYESPIDSVNTEDDEYSALMAINVGNFSNNECNTTFVYAVNINPNLTSDDGSTKGSTIFAMVAIFGLLALAVRGGRNYGNRNN